MEVKRKISNITSKQLYKLLNTTRRKIVVLDVREKDEVDKGKIPGSLFIPRSYLELRIENVVPEKDTPIVAYCATGGRSIYVVKTLHDMGYQNVYNLSGGIESWIRQGYPVEKRETPFNITIGEDNDFFYRRYERHLQIPQIGERGQKKLLNSKILVIGAGGLGCPALLYLTAAGVGNLGIIDNDVVDESNLQRQIIHLSTFIGRPKIESAYFTLKSLNPYINIKTHYQQLNKDNIIDIFKQYDIVIDGSDNFPTRYLVNDACVFLKKTYIHGSIFRFEGQVSTFSPPKTACYRCVYPVPPSRDLTTNCQDVGVLGVLPGLIGILQATEAIKVIVGIGKPLYNQLLYYCALDNTFKTIKINKNKKCVVCSKNPAIKRLQVYKQTCAPE